MGMSFLNIFASSPFRAMQKHMDSVDQTVLALEPFFKEVLQQNWDMAKIKQEEVATLEGKADILKKEICLHLPSGLFMPVNRSDLLGLLHAQDRIANRAKDIAGLVLGRKMQIPDPIAENLMEFLQASIKASKQAKKAIHELDELLETGFKGREVDLVRQMVNELDNREKQSDNLQVKVREKLFEHEQDLPPVDVVFLYKIIDLMGEIADCAQKVGQGLLLLLAK